MMRSDLFIAMACASLLLTGCAHAQIAGNGGAGCWTHAETERTIVDDIGLKIIEEAFVNQLPIDEKIITKLEEMKVQGDSAEAN